MIIIVILQIIHYNCYTTIVHYICYAVNSSILIVS